jgi:hypothetical protein
MGNEPVGGPAQEPDVIGGSENLPPHQGEDRAAAGGCRHGEQAAPAVLGGGLADRKRPGLPPVFPAPGGTLDGIRSLSAAD